MIAPRCLGLVLLVNLSMTVAAAQVGFQGVVELSRAATSNFAAGSYAARYQFTLTLPPQGPGLAGIELELPDTNGAFYGLRPPSLSQVRVFIPTEPTAQRTQVPQEAIPFTGSYRDNTLVLALTTPVAAGQVVTVEFADMANPRMAGNYLVGITAIPSGLSPLPRFVGFGRLHFISGGRNH